MKKTLIAIVAIAVILVLWGIGGYNKLVTLNQSADAQWANVEAQYQRRFDLIPNLVNSVKAVLTQEQTIFSQISEARTRYAGATTPDEKAAAASDVETSLGRLLVIMENYPQLNSNTTVQSFMSQLEGTENRISVERTRFNDIIREYNTTIKRFPTMILAALTGHHERHYFEAAQGAAQAPQVNF